MPADDIEFYWYAPGDPEKTGPTRVPSSAIPKGESLRYFSTEARAWEFMEEEAQHELREWEAVLSERQRELQEALDRCRQASLHLTIIRKRGLQKVEP